MPGLTWGKATVPSGVDRRLSAVSYGGGTFAAVPGSGSGSSGASAYSYNGPYWNKGDVLYLSGPYRGITYGNGKFVSVGGSEESKYSIYSTDGISWQQVSMPGTHRWAGIAYGGGNFIAVSIKGISLNNSQAARSSDGVSWEYVPISHSYNWCGISYGDGKFVVVSNEGYFTYSSDKGATWSTPGKIADGYSFPYIVYGNGYFIAVGTSKVAYSATGMGWATATLSSTGTWGPITYGNGRLVIASTSTSKAIYSDAANGTVWTETSLPALGTGESWSGIAYGNGRFVVVGGGSSSAIIAYSNDQLNSPPTAPDYITVPEEVYTVDSFQISWGASADPDGNLSGYEVQRAYDGGSSWQNVSSSVTETSLTTSVEDGHTSVRYRVRAKDSKGATSSWTTSSSATIGQIKAYATVSGKNRAGAKLYATVGGKIRQVQKGYATVGGKIKKLF